jgi:hypothetical protein
MRFGVFLSHLCGGEFLIIHHHTGGLERRRTQQLPLDVIHHHTGGLESNDF